MRMKSWSYQQARTFTKADGHVQKGTGWSSSRRRLPSRLSFLERGGSLDSSFTDAELEFSKFQTVQGHMGK